MPLEEPARLSRTESVSCSQCVRTAIGSSPGLAAVREPWLLHLAAKLRLEIFDLKLGTPYLPVGANEDGVSGLLELHVLGHHLVEGCAVVERYEDCVGAT